MGIFSNGSQPHTHNTLLIRSSLVEAIDSISQDSLMAIATRAPKQYAESIVQNLIEQGVQWNGPILSKEDVQFENENLFSYKNLSQLYKRLRIHDPSREAVIVGDFLRFPSDSSSINRGYTCDDYLLFDFQESSEVLFNNYALNDHPFPHNEKTPIYVVVPQPWTTQDSQGRLISLDMAYVVEVLEEMFQAGDNNFDKGFDESSIRTSPNQYVVSSGLSQKTMGFDHQQKYLVMKGEKSDWKPLVKLM